MVLTFFKFIVSLLLRLIVQLLVGLTPLMPIWVVIVEVVAAPLEHYLTDFIVNKIKIKK